MPRYRQECVLNYNIADVYSMILDVDKYSEFLPWCSESTVLRSESDETLAELKIQYKGIGQCYTSLVKHSICGDVATINAAMVEGPFSYLNNEWSLKAIGDKETEVKFYIDFEFKSSMLNKIMEIFFYSACQKMAAAFEERAETLFGKKK